MADLKTNVPQEGRDLTVSESLPSSSGEGCPTDSGGGKKTLIELERDTDSPVPYPRRESSIMKRTPPEKMSTDDAGSCDAPTEGRARKNSFIDDLFEEMVSPLFNPSSQGGDSEETTQGATFCPSPELIYERHRRKKRKTISPPSAFDIKREVGLLPMTYEERLKTKPECKWNLEALDKVAKDMMNFINATTNVHKPLKKMVRSLADITRRVKADDKYKSAKYWELWEERKTGTADEETDKDAVTFSEPTSEERRGALPASSISTGTQTDEHELREADSEGNVAEEMQRATGDPSYPLKSLLKKTWPESLYRTTTVVKGPPLQADRTWDVGILLNLEEKQLQTGISRIFRDRYPELAEDDVEPNSVGVTYIIQTLTRRGKDVPKEDTKYIWKLQMDLGSNDSDPEVRWEQLRMKLKALAGRMEETDRQKIAIPLPTNTQLDSMRKIVEIVFGDSKKEVAIHVPNNYAGPGREPQMQEDNTRVRQAYREKQTGAITIKKSGVTFAELLKEVKDKAEKDSNLKIHRAQKTKNGDLLLVTEKNEEAIEAFKEVLKEKISEAKVRTYSGRNEATQFLHLSDIECGVTDNEIVDAIRKELEDQNLRVSVKFLRPSHAGMQISGVEVGMQTAMKLINAGEMKLGIGYCKIRKRLKITRCFRCWEVGHVGAQCNGPNREMLCRKCGQEGHVERLCAGGEFCLTCSRTGHRTGTVGCGKHRMKVGLLLRSASRQQDRVEMRSDANPSVDLMTPKEKEKREGKTTREAAEDAREEMK